MCEVEELVELGKKLPQHENTKDMVQLLTIKLDDVREENAKLKLELDKLHMVRLLNQLNGSQCAGILYKKADSIREYFCSFMFGRLLFFGC